MADIIKIRGAAFIPNPWIEVEAGEEGKVEFEGDGREFTPHAINTSRCRLEQEVVVDFIRGEMLTYSDTGFTRMRTMDGDDVEVTEGRASSDGIGVENVEWGDKVKFDLVAEASNPLIEGSAPIEYDLSVEVTQEGAVTLGGGHHGYPCYEFYKQINMADFERLYIYDYRQTDHDLHSLGGKVDYKFEKTV
ncbi:MAG: DUF3238 domain-containing protein [Halobacteria archaeon]